MSLLAGAAVRDITPPASVALYGYPHVRRISSGVHDPLLASVLVLRTDSGAVVLASLDVLMMAPPLARALRNAVAQAAACSADSVLISCTHTHSGPVTSQLIGWSDDKTIPAPDPDYLVWLGRQLVAATVEACSVTVPAALAWTAADATGVGGNRLSADGVTDPECGLLAVRAAGGGSWLALVMIYGMHPTILHEDSTLVSSDFPHYTRLHIAEQVGCGVPVLYHSAPCGNQSPRRHVAAQTFGEAERLGRKLGAAAWRALLAIPAAAWQAKPLLVARLAPIELPRNAIRSVATAERLLAECRACFARLQREQAPRAEIRTAECAVFGAEGALTLATAADDGRLEHGLRDYTPVELHCLRIADTVLIGLPGECFTEYGLEIKRRAALPAFVISLVNGDLQGYIVTPEAAAAGGYEAANAVFAPAAGRVLVEKALEMVAAISSERRDMPSQLVAAGGK